MPHDVLDPTPTFAAARLAFNAFVDSLARDARTVALHDSDADGVTAGVVWQLAFERAGFAQAVRVIPDRERNAWTNANKERVRACAPESPLIAQIWRSRLPRYIVIAANEGYLPNRVNFSARSAPNVSVLDFLRDIELRGGEGFHGHGHDQASGGSLPTERWNELLAKLGFSSEVFAVN